MATPLAWKSMCVMAIQLKPVAVRSNICLTLVPTSHTCLKTWMIKKPLATDRNNEVMSLMMLRLACKQCDATFHV